MKKKSKWYVTVLSVILSMVMMMMPVCAASKQIEPYYNNILNAGVIIDFDEDFVAHCTLTITEYSHAAGVSGMMKLFDGDGNQVAIWSVSDYEEPYVVENTYQAKRGETYTLTFEGYVYSTNHTPADRLELSIEGTCRWW